MSSQFTEFKVNPKLPFKRLGPSGLRVPVLSLGGWLTFGGTVKGDLVKEIMKTAFENGINMIDTAESYSKGQSEVEIGRVIKELNWRRSDLIITTKIFFGVRDGPNDRGLSRKHIIEGLNGSLQRLGLDYVDVVFAHRPDPTVPMEEVVRAFNHVIDKGQAFYWATSEWTAREIEQAFHVANRLGLIGPIAEQCQHNLFHRDRPEGEYIPIYQQYGIGTTVWSALASGVLTGKYNNGIPANSRFDQHKDFFKDTLQALTKEEGLAKIEKVKKLDELAKKELNATVTQLSLAFISIQPQTSTIILGCSSKEQLLDQLKALDVIEQLKKRPDIVEKVEDILGNKPKKAHTYGR